MRERSGRQDVPERSGPNGLARRASAANATTESGAKRSRVGRRVRGGAATRSLRSARGAAHSEAPRFRRSGLVWVSRNLMNRRPGRRRITFLQTRNAFPELGGRSDGGQDRRADSPNNLASFVAHRASEDRSRKWHFVRNGKTSSPRKDRASGQQNRSRLHRVPPVRIER